MTDTPPDDGDPRPHRTPKARRTRATVAAELVDVERYLAEVPPHSGGGRDHLASRRAALQRELATFDRTEPT